MAHILIADDSPTEIHVLQQLLLNEGHDVMTVEDGKRAVDYAETRQPDLIIMDVVMPKINGFQATRQLTRQESTKHIPIIIISSKNQETDKLWGLRQGAKGYLYKPVDEKALLELINSLLAGKTS